MANIGSFKKSGTEYLGDIVTLGVQAKGVRIVPETSRANGDAPAPGPFDFVDQKSRRREIAGGRGCHTRSHSGRTQRSQTAGDRVVRLAFGRRQHDPTPQCHLLRRTEGRHPLPQLLCIDFMELQCGR